MNVTTKAKASRDSSGFAGIFWIHQQVEADVRAVGNWV
jgi:hypothetical protein